MNLRFVLAAYGAAGASFLASLVRDYTIINHTDQDKAFFQLFYVVSMAAGFGVNAIALGSGALRSKALAVLALIGIGVIVVMLPQSQATPTVVALLVGVLLMWIAGAQWSRTLIERGWVFCGRIREAIASVVLAALVLSGMAVNPAFAVAVAIGTAFSWAMWLRVRGEPDGVARSDGRAGAMSDLARSIVLTNVSTMLISYWALVQTGLPGEAFGFERSTVVRFAMYIYQILVIGSVVLVSRGGRLLPRLALQIGVALAALVFLMAWFLPIGVAFVLTPAAATVMHYGLVLLLQHHARAQA